MTIERTTEQRDLTDLSASRINLAQKCGLAFRYNYVDRLPDPMESARAIFGTVIHRSVEDWYGGNGPVTPDNALVHKDLSLPEIVEARWPEHLPPEIWNDVVKLRDLDAECEGVAQMILLQRPQLKSPRSTKAFLESEAVAEFSTAKVEMLQRIEGFKEIQWPTSEDPFKAFKTSLEMAERLQNEWRPLPRPLLVEEPFRLEFDGFVLRGAIDQVRQDPDVQSGELGPIRVLDIKTGQQLMTQMEAFVQSWTYNVAARELDLPEPTNTMEFLMARHLDQLGHTKIQRGTIDPDRHDKLALRILNGVGRKIITGQFEPHYGHWCKLCDYREICESEIAIWKDDGLVVA